MLKKIRSPVFILFSNHNDRAVVALSRFFDLMGLSFVVISGSAGDPIHQTIWADRVIFSRLDKIIDLKLFENIFSSAINQFNEFHYLVYCPTTEFINQFCLTYKNEIESIGISVQLPSAEIYYQLSSKLDSRLTLKSFKEFSFPQELDWEFSTPPCVFKPRLNISHGEVKYPKLCFKDNDLSLLKKSLHQAEWFVEEYIEGQSYYLCGYLSRTGESAHYWQVNLMQQPDGKSIVFARSGENPGIDVDSLFGRLFSLKYFGPLMMEIIKVNDGRNYYIEINPRFWGPLQLALDVCPRVLELFAEDAGALLPKQQKKALRMGWYSWSKGAQQENCKRYPALEEIEEDVSALIRKYDVYAKDDTYSLHNNF